MHDVIRDMALWLVCGDRRDKFLIQLLNSINAHRIERWEEAERIPVCPKLSTLLVKDTMLKMFSNQFFHSMRLLNVLDLSGNCGLVELPKLISELFNLQYLN